MIFNPIVSGGGGSGTPLKRITVEGGAVNNFQTVNGIILYGGQYVEVPVGSYVTTEVENNRRFISESGVVIPYEIGAVSVYAPPASVAGYIVMPNENISMTIA